MPVPLRVGIVGYGTVGRAVAEGLCSRDDPRLLLVRVCGRPGSARPPSLPPGVGWTDTFEAILADDVDVVVELVGGLDPALSWIERALGAGKAVVTANKQLIAEAGARLGALARDHRTWLRFEAAVGGGVPVIRAIQDGLAGDRLVRLAGILNGTCNYILNRMERDGGSFEEALREAQNHGYTEADAAADLSGADAAAKLSILGAVAFGCQVTPAAVRTETIAGISAGDLRAARQRGLAIRQVSRLERAGTSRHPVRASVRPEAVPLDSPLGRAAGCENVIVVTGELGGDTVFAGPGAGGRPTAVAVISDLLSIGAHAHA